MTIVLGIFGVVAATLGGLIFSQAQSAIHEIEAFILFLIAAVLIAGGAIIDAVKAARIATVAALGHFAKQTASQPPSTPRDRDEAIPTKPPGDPTKEWLSDSRPPADPHPIANGAAANEAGARALYAQARQLAETGQRDGAIAALREVVRLYPQSAVAVKARHSLEKSGVA